LGKALGGGIMPVSAVAATPAAFAPFDRDPLLHTSTFGGNPLAAAAAAAALELIRREDIARTCACVGAAIEPCLYGLIERFPTIFRASSGRGLLRGLHFTRPDRAAIFLQKCFSRGLLLTPCLTTPHVLRLSPPAITGTAELELAFDALEHAAQDTLRDLA
jgi:putrescine aminotransferase